MNEKDIKLSKKLSKLDKKVKRIESMIGDIHNRAVCGISSPLLEEDEEINNMLKDLIDLSIEYSGVLENMKIQLYEGYISISGHWLDDNNNNNNNDQFNDYPEPVRECHYNINIHSDSVSFDGNIFDANYDVNFRIKSDIYELYLERLREVNKELKRRVIVSGFNKIFEKSNLNRGRSMRQLENL